MQSLLLSSIEVSQLCQFLPRWVSLTHCSQSSSSKGLTWICMPSKRHQCPETRLNSGYQNCSSEPFQIPIPTYYSTSCRNEPLDESRPQILSDPACWHGISMLKCQHRSLSVCLPSVSTHTHKLAPSNPSVSEKPAVRNESAISWN